MGGFILGSCQGSEEKHKLTISEMPRAGAQKGRLQSTDRYQNDVHYTNPTGGNQPHNNIPPYYVLTYIIKL